ncbi:Alpha/Beta hydrolase protein [Apodospora peruviana]|uniref:Alpha/Beta hydrolase protein n=1 Tax=Apodospora peruviana TaxID=516989 RepID=A0AAE0IJ23_9PEZI|nr:Alpha/Beta hydrolase protein [Apodospora peruviana]
MELPPISSLKEKKNSFNASAKPNPSSTSPAKTALWRAAQLAAFSVLTVVVGYCIFLALLAIPFLQSHVIYLHGVTLTWFQDVNVPEQWGFLRNQVTPFTLSTPDGERLHAWHILPLDLYRRHEQRLVQEPDGMALDIKTRLGFQLLRDDPDALLVLYLHGAAGTLGSGFRPPSYRAMYAGAPTRIHTVAIDYRGFGASTGVPSEQGLLTDALTLVRWAIDEAGMPHSRIVLFAQSLGTAVAISLVHHLSQGPDPILFSGMVLVAPFADVELLTATYRVAGTIPILDPLAYFPRLLAFFNGFILHKWPSKDKLAEIIKSYHDTPASRGKEYDITIIHAEDDYDIPWSHSDQLFWHGVRAAKAAAQGQEDISFEELEGEKKEARRELGAAGWVASHETERGIIREEIVKWGLHDRIMSYPVVSLAVLRAFHLEDR